MPRHLLVHAPSDEHATPPRVQHPHPSTLPRRRIAEVRQYPERVHRRRLLLVLVAAAVALAPLFVVRFSSYNDEKRTTNEPAAAALAHVATDAAAVVAGRTPTNDAHPALGLVLLAVLAVVGGAAATHRRGWQRTHIRPAPALVHARVAPSRGPPSPSR